MKKLILFAMTFVAINASAAMTCTVQFQIEDYEVETEVIQLQGIDTQVGFNKDKSVTLAYNPQKPGVLNVQLIGDHCQGYSNCSADIDTVLNGKLNIDFAGLEYQAITCK